MLHIYHSDLGPDLTLGDVSRASNPGLVPTAPHSDGPVLVDGGWGPCLVSNPHHRPHRLPHRPDCPPSIKLEQLQPALSREQEEWGEGGEGGREAAARADGSSERWAKAKAKQAGQRRRDDPQQAPIAGEPCRCAVTNHRRDQDTVVEIFKGGSSST